MNDFAVLLEESVGVHGHLCPGQVLGVRMSMLGLREIGITDPKGKDRKSIMVFVEMDRCATDAVQSVTGCSLGHRTMKFMDYGKMAATFLNLLTGRAVRVIAKEESRQKAKDFFPGIEDKYAAQLEAYKIMDEEDLFDVIEVRVKLEPEDMPGRPLRRVRCDICGEYVQDSREVYRFGKTLCRPCAGTGYYECPGWDAAKQRLRNAEAAAPEAFELPDSRTYKLISATEAVGMILTHDITEIRPGEFKGAAFKKGHVVREEDVCHLQRLGKEHLYALHLEGDQMHEDDAAFVLADALVGEGVEIKGGPKEGKISIVASKDGLLKINEKALLAFNMVGEVMCATLHNNTVVKKGQAVAGTRAIPLVVKKDVVQAAADIGNNAGKIIRVKEMRRPRAGVVVAGSEVYHGRIKDAFAPVVRNKMEAIGGQIVGIYYAPDDASFIEERLRELICAGADLLITTGGMSVDPDDVTRFAIKKLGATDITYGSAVLPGAMFLVAYIKDIPILGIPACGMYAKTTVFDLVLPRVLAGEKIGRSELAEFGHGGLCMKCDTCRYPMCPFGK